MARFDAVPIGNLIAQRDEHLEKAEDAKDLIRFHEAEAAVRTQEINLRLSGC